MTSQVFIRLGADLLRVGLRLGPWDKLLGRVGVGLPQGPMPSYEGTAGTLSCASRSR